MPNYVYLLHQNLFENFGIGVTPSPHPLSAEAELHAFPFPGPLFKKREGNRQVAHHRHRVGRGWGGLPLQIVSAVTNMTFLCKPMGLSLFLFRKVRVGPRHWNIFPAVKSDRKHRIYIYNQGHIIQHHIVNV